MDQCVVNIKEANFLYFYFFTVKKGFISNFSVNNKQCVILLIFFGTIKLLHQFFIIKGEGRGGENSCLKAGVVGKYTVGPILDHSVINL